MLPEKMRKMTNLRHLVIKDCDDLRRMPVGMRNLSCLRTLSMFVVAPGTGHGITELQGLDHLTGELKIQGLEHVRNLKDAKNANLMRKKHLRALSLFWSEKNNGTIEEEEEEEEEEEVASIGEGFQPHPNLRVLELNCYNGLKFPSWTSHSCLPNLVEISLVGCRRCKHLLPFGQLPLLKVLKIDGMDYVKCIGDEFYGDHHLQGSSLFPSLIELEIHYMPNLEEWYAPSSTEEEEEEEEENIRVFSSLECLTLKGCPKLRTLPTTFLSSLRELTLGGECNEMMLESSSLVKVLGCLQRLNIVSINKMTLPKVFMENLPSTLTKLSIWGCMELVCLPEGVMQNLTSLYSFYLIGCPSLKVLPELGSKNNTSSLRRLHILFCDGLTSVSDCLRHLTALEDLWIQGTPELKFLPDDFQDLTSLRKLTIIGLPQMTCLPEGLQQVAGTLKVLNIFDCSGLTSLPEWMDKFTSFERLTISDCHLDLHRRYAKETGEDWHKIAHIPDLRIIESREWKIEHDGIGGGGKRCSMIPCFS